MDREKRIFELADTVLLANFRENKNIFAEELSKNYNSICKTYKDALRNLVKKAKKQQQAGIKNTIHFVAIATLRSSSITGSYDFMISLLDENYYLDATETSVCWAPTLIYKRIEDDFSAYAKVLAKNIVRPSARELQLIKNLYLQMHHNIAGQMLVSMTRDAFLESGAEEIALADEVHLLLGGYLDAGDEFDTLRKEDFK